MTTKTVEVQDAQQQLALLLDEVAAGTEIILTEDNKPRARLVAINVVVPRRIPGLNRGSMTMSDDFDEPLPDEFWTGEA
jgi:prevent-host-death family protein